MHETNRFPRPFGKYLLLRQLAVGGMAEVYLARQSGPAGFEKECVIKRILPSLALDGQFVQMFLDEARIAARLSHPNIVQIYDLGDLGGHDYFLAMEHVHGVDLQQILEAERERGGRVPLAIALRIAIQVAAGLDHAHHATDPRGLRLGIVHRDVTPSNVIVSFDGAAKVLDFGIAKAERKATRTEVGVVKGKVPYMSPEQIQGEAMDARSDLFSLGTMIYELTTGQKPFDGPNSAAISLQLLHDDVRPPALWVDRYPDALAEIVLKALAKRPNDRWQSAREIEEALEDFLQRSGIRCSAHEVGAYIEELFPGRRELQHADAAATLPVEVTDPTVPMNMSRDRDSRSSGPKPSPTSDLSGTHGQAEPGTGPGVAGPDLSMRLGDVPEDVRRNLGGGGKGVMVVVVLLVVATAGAFWYLRQRGSSNGQATSPPAATGEDHPAVEKSAAPAEKPVAGDQPVERPSEKPIVAQPLPATTPPGEKPAVAEKPAGEKPPVTEKPIAVEKPVAAAKPAAEKHTRPPKHDKPKSEAGRPLPRLPTPPPADDAP